MPENRKRQTNDVDSPRRCVGCFVRGRSEGTGKDAACGAGLTAPEQERLHIPLEGSVLRKTGVICERTLAFRNMKDPFEGRIILRFHAGQVKSILESKDSGRRGQQVFQHRGQEPAFACARCVRPAREILPEEGVSFSQGLIQFHGSHICV